MSELIQNDMTVSYAVLFMDLFNTARKVLCTRDGIPDHEARDFSGTLQRIGNQAHEKVRIYNANLQYLRLWMPRHRNTDFGATLAWYLDHMGQEGEQGLREFEEDLTGDVEETAKEVYRLLKESRVVVEARLHSMFLARAETGGSQGQRERDVEEGIRCEAA